ncbi:9110_t:CDS:2, partial [Dentiscutata erythropus]
MLLPPLEVYNSAEELFLNAQRFANSQGYVLIKKRTRKDNHAPEIEEDVSYSEDSFQSLLQDLQQ